jgi:hypothetical protein
MKKLSCAIVLALTVAGCSRGDALEIRAGSDVTVQTRDGVSVSGRLVEVQPEQVILQDRSGAKTVVRRADIQSIAAEQTAERRPEASPASTAPAAEPVPTTGTPAPADTRAAAVSAPVPVDPPSESRKANQAEPRAPEYREITIPSGTLLPVELQSAVGSDTSSPEDPVRGRLRRAVTIDGAQVLPAGTALLGHVTSAQRPGKVKGRGAVAFRFNQIDLPGDGGRMPISSRTISRLAPATKKQDAAKIGGGAVGGAIVGGILGGGDGAAKGAAIGGGAGSAVVLSTRGKDVRLGAGAPLSVRLTAPLKVRVAVK